jgi:NADPH:quinone reductase
MQAVVFERFGEPGEVLGVRDVPVPEPKPGEVRVRMLAAPINPSDLMVVRGTYSKLPSLPATPGFEGVGIVEAANAGLFGRFLMGKRVAVLNSSSGSWAEYAVLNARQAIPLSKQLSVEQAAMFFVNPATAFILTRKVLAVPAGEWLLQTAAGSALGRMIIRLGRRCGFRTIHVVRRASQVDELKSLGADEVLVEGNGDFSEQVRRITGGKGVRFAVDPVGGTTGSAIVRELARDGRLILFGTLSGQPLSFSPRDLMTPGAAIEGFWLGNWMARQTILSKLKLVRELTALILDGTLASDVGESLSLDRIQDAIRAAENPDHGRKTLLRLGVS